MSISQFFRYPYFIARTALAVIDHNFHLSRPYATTREGLYAYTRTYCKGTKHWHAELLKIKKQYPYLDILQAKVLLERYNDEKSASLAAPRKASDPRNISLTTAIGKEPPSTSELIKLHKSRFGKNKISKVSNERDNIDIY